MKKLVSPVLIFSIVITGVLPLSGQLTVKGKRTSEIVVPVVKDDAVATRFGRVSAITDGSVTKIDWEMAVERSNIGFRVYRLTADGKNAIGEIIPSFVTADIAVKGMAYSFADRSPSDGSAYIVEAINKSGSKTQALPVTPTYSSVELDLGRYDDDPAANLVQSDLNLPKVLQDEIGTNLQVPDVQMHKWVIGQEGVRIGVRESGMYRITSEELAAAGFNTTADPALWQLYVDGNEQAINVGPGGSYVEFFAKNVNTVESDTRAYFLIVGNTQGKRMSKRVARPSAGTVVMLHYDQTFQLRERTTYNQNILNGDAENFWGRTIGASPTTLNFTLPDVDLASGAARLTVYLQGFSNGNHQLQMVLNGTPIGSATGNGVAPFTGSIDINASQLVNGTNTLQMSSVAPGSPADVSLFDRMEVFFGRKFAASSGRLSFYTENDRKARLEGFTTSDIRVFDSTFEGDFAEITGLVAVPQGPTFGLEMPAARGRQFIAYEQSAFLQPASITLNDPENLSDPANSADLVIIAYKAFLPEAEIWAQYRTAQGISVKVVEVSEIYDEFNFGILSADSIKHFLQMTTKEWANAPEYVLLIGDTTVDPRNYRNLGFAAFVPTRMVDTVFTETGSDEFLADFNGDGLAEMAIGRVAARTNAEVTRVYNKTVYWEANFVNSLSRGVLFAHDRIDGYDFEAVSARLRNQLPEGTPATMVHRDEANAQANLLAAMNSGKFFTNYAGHGAVGVWAASNFFANSVVPQVINPNNESVFTMLTCLNGYFMTLGGSSLAETLVHHPNGGAVAAWSSTGLTTPDVQELMATRFYRKLGDGDIPRLGDLIRNAKSAIPGGSDVRLSWALLGDPMLKVRELPPPAFSKSK